MTFGGYPHRHPGDIHNYNTRQSPANMRAFLRTSASRQRSLVFPIALLMALAGCNQAGGGAQAGAREEVQAVPVEVAEAANRTIAASYTGTASLDALAEA